MERINFKQERDLGATLQDASTFIKQNFFKMMKPTLLVVAIPLLLGSVMIFTGLQDMFGNMEAMNEDPTMIFSFMGEMFVSYFMIIIALILSYVMFYGYIKLYVAGQEEITLGDLMPILKSKGISLTFSAILLFILMYIGLFLCVLPGIYLSIVFVHFFVISIVEETGFCETWKRSFFLIKDNWWYAFGLYFVTYLISLGIMMIFYIPIYAIMGVELLSAVEQNDPAAAMSNYMSSMSYVFPFYYLAALLMSLLFSVVSALCYFSLVEQKEGTGERELIDSL